MINPQYDILCASYFRHELFSKLLSYFDNIAPLQNLKNIYIIVHSEDHETMELVRSFQRKLPIKIVEVATKLMPGVSRNLLISHSEAEYVLFLDDDIIPNKDYFSYSQEIIQEHCPDVFGGPDQPRSEEGRAQELVSSVLSSPFVTGATYRRHNRNTSMNLKATELDLTLCNLWVKRAALGPLQYYFDEKIMRAEECDLLNRLAVSGQSLYYFPDLYVFHYRRVKVWELFKLHLRAGCARTKIILKSRRNYHFFFLIPILCGLITPVTLVYSPISFSLLVVLHFLLSIFTLLKLKEVRNLSECVYSCLVIVVIHLGFSLGMISGIILPNARKN
ncbi:glycosyltransferase [Halobacteriovorax sp. HLS]|uniref:glycosyltransferase n=1 Tax=Halobacteriovorax sp. HLS TaxID=2234000 RepID=UPI000FD92277|nr:glycosyltransferase [Halobacteriovorax sp. HLS]